jgi:hypothetical protein
MRTKRSVLAPVIVAALALLSGGWFLQREASLERNVYFQARIFEEVVQHITDRFVDEQEPSRLYRMAIDGLLRELDDPHTSFMTAEEYARLQERFDAGGDRTETSPHDACHRNQDQVGDHQDENEDPQISQGEEALESPHPSCLRRARFDGSGRSGPLSPGPGWA